jgi:hypothetical protein
VPKNPFLVGEIYEPGDITLLKHINKGLGDQIKYVLVNTVDGKIKAVNDSSPEFYSIISGDYRVYAITHRPEAVVSGIAVGNKLSDVTPFCSNWASYNINVIVSCNYDANWTMTNAAPAVSSQTSKFALIDVGLGNQIVQISDSATFPRELVTGTYQIVQLLYTGSISNLTIGSTINALSGSNLDLTASKHFKYCEAVFLAIDGYIINDKNKNGKEDFPADYPMSLSSHSNIYVKITDQTNQVVTASYAYFGNFSLSPYLADGEYRLIYDNNDDLTDTVPNYPANWSGSPKYFTVFEGAITSPKLYSLL